jgi:hypothetical protein
MKELSLEIRTEAIHKGSIIENLQKNSDIHEEINRRLQLGSACYQA